MFILSNLYNFLFTDIRTTILSLIIGLIVYKLSRFYVRVFSLPPGPIPIPVLGNILYFRGTKEHWTVELEKIPKKYGPIFTFWIGGEPVVIISDIELGREVFRKNDFAGRPQIFLMGDVLSNEKHTDILMADYGHRWEALRRVAHSAIQKYATTDKLMYLSSDCVEQSIKLIIEKEGLNKPFVPFEYIYHLFLNIMCTSAFGKSIDMNDKEYKQIKYAMKDFNKEHGNRVNLVNLLKVFQLIDRKFVNKMIKMFTDFLEMIRIKYQNHYKDYDESVVRDFCDTLISAKNDALKEGKESAPYLTDDNLAMAVSDMFFAGTDTSQGTFRWLLLFLVYYPNIQKKLRQEIESEIGDRIPTHEDRNQCHYVMAFISETLRFRNIAPAGVPHKAIVTSKIGSYTIPEGTSVNLFQGYILKCENYWPNGDQFIPERFLENGKYMTTRPTAFIPFGFGRRVCLGEKLAIADLFLVLVRFIQLTSDYDIVLHSDGGIDPDPHIPDAPNPKEFKISFNKKKIN